MKDTLWLRQLLLILILSGSGGAGPIRCTLIVGKNVESRSPSLVSVLKTHLSQDSRLELVEKTETDGIIDEQRIGRLLAPTGLSDRMAVGKLLPADLLVVLENGQSFIRSSSDRLMSSSHLRVVVAETHQGLRLVVWNLPFDAQVDVTVAVIVDCVHQACQKQAIPTRQVFSVPPFKSNDTLSEYSYLQSALAAIVEQTLLQYPGVIVVERDEAGAMAAELTYAEAGAQISRVWPLYIMGEYRNDGTRENRRLSLRLSLEYGQDPVLGVVDHNVAPGEVGDMLRGYAAECIERIAGEKVAVPDGTKEAAQLAGRADEFIGLAAWPQALSMLEASLLLDSSRTEVHGKAVFVLTQLAGQPGLGSNVSLDYCRLGIPHLEAHLRGGKIAASNSTDLLSNYWTCTQNIKDPRGQSPYLDQLISDVNKEKREMLLRVMSDVANSGKLDAEAAHVLTHYPFLACGKIDETPEENYAQRLRAIRIVAGIPGIRQADIENLLANDSYAGSDGARYLAFLDKLAEISDPAVRSLEKSLREREENARGDKAASPVPPPVSALSHREDTGGSDVVFEPLVLPPTSSPGTPKVSPLNITGFLACGDGIDCLCTSTQVYLLDSTTMRCVYTAPGGSTPMEPCYDGRYLWLPVMGGGNSWVIAIDMTNGKIEQFTAQDGLPLFETKALCVPIVAGRVCVAGGSTDGAWCADLSLDERGAKRVDVFHKAMRNPAEYAEGIGAAANPNLAFVPQLMKPVSAPKGDNSSRIVLWRSCRLESANSHPLLINPDLRSVHVLPVVLPSDHVTCHDGALYWIARDATSGSYGLWSLELNADAPSCPIFSLPCTGSLVSYDGAIHVIGNQWLAARRIEVRNAGPRGQVLSTIRPVYLKVQWPQNSSSERQFYVTHRYGLVMVSAGQAYRVQFLHTLEKVEVLNGSNRGIFRGGPR